ncbi:MAG: TrkH family potassium uptake protein [Ruminococcaceae bacterium]|nr:TrkH family potassium uptake protein [Oscillospiraceae bacterium]
MNRKLVFNYLGRICASVGALMIVPIICALCYREYGCLIVFCATALLSLGIGWLLTRFCKPSNDLLYAKEGFAIVALAWVFMSLLGALPFFVTGEIPNYIDAFFETVSGFTTTGASIIENVETMSKSLLMWRSFTHWVGGMGVLVFIMAILPGLPERSVHVMKAEMPGPMFGKIVPRARDTAKILYIIYIAMTLILTVFLLFGGMSLYESLIHAFGTAGTGGFSCNADSVLGYSPYIQWVITIFMILFGVNFYLYYYFLIKRSFTAFKSTEFVAYLGIVIASAAAICVNIVSKFDSISEAARHSSFAVASIISTTGFATVDYDLWPEFSKTILLILMFIGGCAGSTGGGLKVSRIVLLFKMIFSEIRHMLHPRAITAVRLDGKTVDKSTLHSVSTYFALFVVCYTAIFAALTLIEPSFDFLTNFSAVAACINNVGPGFNKVGPTGNFSIYNDFSTLILSLTMLLGRLEIFPLLLTFMPGTWKKQ